MLSCFRRFCFFFSLFFFFYILSPCSFEGFKKAFDSVTWGHLQAHLNSNPEACHFNIEFHQVQATMSMPEGLDDHKAGQGYFSPHGKNHEKPLCSLALKSSSTCRGASIVGFPARHAQRTLPIIRTVYYQWMQSLAPAIAMQDNECEDQHAMK